MTLCPISGKIMDDPVCINGIHYDRNSVVLYISK